jgi:hypothetical protein
VPAAAIRKERCGEGEAVDLALDAELAARALGLCGVKGNAGNYPAQVVVEALKRGLKALYNGLGGKFAGWHEG